MRRGALCLHVLCLLAAAVILEACPSKPPRPAVRFPITGGFHRVLPSAGQPILVWSDPPLADLALEWLRNHRYATIAAARYVSSGPDPPGPEQYAR